MVRVSSPAKLRPWSELTAKMVMGVVLGLLNSSSWYVSVPEAQRDSNTYVPIKGPPFLVAFPPLFFFLGRGKLWIHT